MQVIQSIHKNSLNYMSDTQCTTPAKHPSWLLPIAAPPIQLVQILEVSSSS